METYDTTEHSQGHEFFPSENCDCGYFSLGEMENFTEGGFAKPDREILHAVAKTSSMAIESLKDLLKENEECGLCGVLKRQIECYKTIYKIAEKGLLSIDEDTDKIGGMQKMMLWTSTKWDMMMDDSDSKVAELLIRGTSMGVCEVGKAMNDFKNVSTHACSSLGDKTMHAMSEFVDQLKKFL